MEYSKTLFGRLLCTLVVCHFVGVYTVPVEDNKTDGGSFPPKESEQTTQKSCCERQSKRIIAGYDTSRRPVYLDVGHCRQTCEAAWYEDNTQQADAVRSCPQKSTCLPTRIKVERYSLMEGPVDHEIIEECQCSRAPAKCKRKPFKKVYFLNTPYQVEIDVGMCTGHCKKSPKSCQPKQNKTITIRGPNGDETVSVIRKCQCAGTCYRMRHLQVYNQTYLDETTWQLKSRRKVIDVGTCTGSCTEHGRNRCLKWSNTKPKRCVMTLQDSDKDCMPTSHRTHNFKTTDYEERIVLSVRSCGCRKPRT